MSADAISHTINEIFTLRAMALAARALIEPATDSIPDDPETMRERLDDLQDAGESAKRILQQLAAQAQDLTRRLDGALAEAVAQLPEDEVPLGEEATVSDADADLHDIASDLSGEVAYLLDYIELADEQATNHRSGGKTVALLDAAVARVKRVRELAEAIEGKSCRLGGAQ